MPLNVSFESQWRDADGNPCNLDMIRDEIVNYVSRGGKIYIGSDSMLLSYNCNFVVVIAFHNRELDIARYYYKKFRTKSEVYKELQTKILEEVSLAINTAQLVLEICPKAEIELHIDIGKKKKNATSKFFSMIQGWVNGIGFDFRVKPNSWASSLADSHTKGRHKNGNNNN